MVTICSIPLSVSSVWDEARPWQTPARSQEAGTTFNWFGWTCLNVFTENQPSISLFSVKKLLVSRLTGHYVIYRPLQERFWNNSWHDDASSLTCFIIPYIFFLWNRSFSSPVFKKCKHVYSRLFPPLFILLQLFCFLSCSDATAVQTPFPPADSVASLRRCGSGCWWRGGGGWGKCEAPTSGPLAYHMRGKRAG